MTRIVVLSECHFTRLGLAALLHPRYAVFSTTDCLALQSRLSSGATTALVILSVSGRETLPSLAECVRRLHRSQPHCAVLLDPGAVSTPLLRYYFNDLHGNVGVIDLAQPVAALHRFIEQVVSGQVTLSAEVIAGQSCLNGREREVLQTLMSGVSPTDIARTLTLSVNTVSHYKRTGLFKLGARSLQTLLSPDTQPHGTPRGQTPCRQPSASLR